METLQVTGESIHCRAQQVEKRTSLQVAASASLLGGSLAPATAAAAGIKMLTDDVNLLINSLFVRYTSRRSRPAPGVGARGNPAATHWPSYTVTDIITAVLYVHLCSPQW